MLTRLVLGMSLLLCSVAQAGTITVSVSGNGAIRDQLGRIDCPALACTASYTDQEQVALTATPGDGASFSSWSGGCSQFSGGSCFLNGGFDSEIGAAFEGGSQPPPANPPSTTPAIVRVLVGDGGRIVSAPAGIDCSRPVGGPASGTCESAFGPGTRVTLTASVSAPRAFNAWSGACSGSDLSCSLVASPGVLEVNASTVEIRPRPGKVDLTIVNGGPVLGGIVNAAGFDIGPLSCAMRCQYEAVSGREVTFEATAALVTPSAGRSAVSVQSEVAFDRWSGACNSFASRCVVRFNGIEDQPLIARFRRKGAMRFRVVGSGVVRSERLPAGEDRIVCARDCSVVLRDRQFRYVWEADPEPGFRFSHWVGFCGRLLEDETCAATEQPGPTRSSTAVFVRDPARGAVRFALVGAVNTRTDVRDFSRPSVIFPPHEPVRLRRGADGVSRVRMIPVSTDPDIEFSRWVDCPHVIENGGRFGTRRYDVCEVRARDRVNGVIHAQFVRDPILMVRLPNGGRLMRGGRTLACTVRCEITIPGGRPDVRLLPTAPDGFFFEGWTGYCGHFGRTDAANACLVRDLWHDELTTAVLRRRGSMTVRVSGGGTVADQRVAGFASPAGLNCFSGQAADRCRVLNGAVGLYRRLKAFPQPGFRFERWEGYCDRIFYNDECDVPGGTESRRTTAVFVRR